MGFYKCIIFHVSMGNVSEGAISDYWDEVWVCEGVHKMTVSPCINNVKI